MRNVLSIMILICTAAAFAVVPHGETLDVGPMEDNSATPVSSIELDLPNGIEYGEYFPPLDLTTLADVNDPSSFMEYSTPVERALAYNADDDPVLSSPLWDWDDDVLIYPGKVGSGVDFDMDDITGDLYAILDTDHATNDSLIVYKSTDGGATWSFFMYSNNTDGEVSNPRIAVGHHGGNTWILMLGIWNESGSVNNLWTRRVKANGSSVTWEQVSGNATYADIDTDIGSSAYAYVTWAEDGNMNIYAARNALTGVGWVNSIILFADPQTSPYPCIAAGAGGNVTVGLLDTRLTTNDEIRIKRSTNSGSTWATSAQVSNNTGGFALTWLDIAFTHAGTQVGWMIAEWAASSDNIAYYYSTNSGSSWTYGAVIGNVDDEKMPAFGALRTTSTGAVTLAYDADPGNMCMFSYADGSSPTNFSTPVQINDAGHSNTSSWPPASGWTGNMSAVMFTSYNNNYSAYFDWYNNTGVADESTAPVSVSGLQNSPNPFYGTTRIDFSLVGTGPVSLEVFDVSGHLVSTPIDGQNLEAGDHSIQWNAGASLMPGVYFCKLTSGDQGLTQRMVLMP